MIRKLLVVASLVLSFTAMNLAPANAVVLLNLRTSDSEVQNTAPNAITSPLLQVIVLQNQLQAGPVTSGANVQLMTPLGTVFDLTNYANYTFSSVNGGLTGSLDATLPNRISVSGSGDVNENWFWTLQAPGCGLSGCEISSIFVPSSTFFPRPTSPVPEPSSLALLVGSLAGLALYRRRRRA